MPEDKRTARSVVSDNIVIQSGDDTDNVLTEINSAETITVDYVKVMYSNQGSTEATVELYDKSEEEGTFGEESALDTLYVSPGDNVIITEATYEDINNGIIATAGGDHDSVISVTVGGMRLTG